jgi:hypothetical protein
VSICWLEITGDMHFASFFSKIPGKMMDKSIVKLLRIKKAKRVSTVMFWAIQKCINQNCSEES